MKNCKYIVIQNGTIDSIIMFGGELTHSRMAEMIGKPVVSAGFIVLGLDVHGNPAVFATGESQSLGLMARVERDTQLARHLLS